MNKPKHQTWIFPWKYQESFIIAFSLIFIGFFIDYLTQTQGQFILSCPTNFIILLSFIGYITITYFFIKHPLINWLASVPAAISAIVVFTILVLLMGFIPQNKTNPLSLINRIGLNHITQSFSYVIISMYLLIILGYTILKRLFPLNIKNIAFLLNHAGLWIVLTSGSLGAGDIVRLTMPINEKQTSNYAYDRDNKLVQLPFSISLIDFSIEEYPPHIILASSSSGKMVTSLHEQKLPEIIQGKSIHLNDWNVFVDKYYKMALISDSIYVPSSDSGAAPAAYIIATNHITNQNKEGWICCGSYNCPPNYLFLSDHLLLGMTNPIPKKYSSIVTIHSSDSKEKSFTIEVNKPIQISGWEIYQSSYDSEKSNWSTISVFELIKDPWYNAVYVGILMMLLGAVLLFWHGKSH